MATQTTCDFCGKPSAEMFKVIVQIVPHGAKAGSGCKKDSCRLCLVLLNDPRPAHCYQSHVADMYKTALLGARRAR